jgi:hypothetical protein
MVFVRRGQAITFVKIGCECKESSSPDSLIVGLSEGAAVIWSTGEEGCTVGEGRVWGDDGRRGWSLGISVLVLILDINYTL